MVCTFFLLVSHWVISYITDYDQVDLMSKQYEEGSLYHEMILQVGIHLIYGKLGEYSVHLFLLGCHKIVIYDISGEGK